MYKSQRRKSGRSTPYDLASSSFSSNRKSGQFVCPVKNPDESYSALNRAPATSTSLLRTTLSDLQNLRNNDNETPRNEQNDPIAKDQQSYEKPASQEAANVADSNVAPCAKGDETMDSEIDRFLDANPEITLGSRSPNRARTSSQSNRSQPVDDYQFSSEFERIFDNSSLASQLNREFNTRKCSQLSTESNLNQETREDEIDNELSRLNERTVDVDDELFDSDAVNNEGSDDERSDDEPAFDDDDDAQEDLDRLAKEELESEDDLFGVDLDDTLIKSDDLADEFITQPVKQFNPNECDFRTAAGDPVQVSMSEEAQRAAAMRLGIRSNFNPADFISQPAQQHNNPTDDHSKDLDKLANEDRSDDEACRSANAFHDEGDLEDFTNLEDIERDFGNFDQEEALDYTLISQPADNFIISQPVQHFDPDAGDFRTAAGNPVQVKMTEEQQRATAKRLGIQSNFDFKSQAFH